MNSSPQAATTTRMFARVLGPFLVLVIAMALARFSDLRNLLSEVDANPLLMWIGGAFTLLSGVVVIALHPYWRGAAAITVSVLGWTTALKGLSLMAIPNASTSFATSAIDAAPVAVVSYVLVGLVGVYLTYVGWAPAGRQSAPQAEGATWELRRAA
ncbi:MAG: hypothetical protein LLG14_19360 [Nocardiaceae bacterium]|nr:hypothetical protein [Nocardiaceae bacterium]